jgi:hypothetical protein
VYLKIDIHINVYVLANKIVYIHIRRMGTHPSGPAQLAHNDESLLGMHTCACIYACMYTYECMFIHLYSHTCMNTCKICTHIYAHINRYIRVYICIYA